jgi:hypothetical protein
VSALAIASAKKAGVVTAQGINHAGLLFNEPLRRFELPFA